MRTWAGWLALGVAAVLGCEATCEAFYLDSDRNFDVRLRAYSQLGILTQDSLTTGCVPVKLLNGTVLPIDPRTCPPPYNAGDLGQNRNFYNPEFDAKLTDYTKGAAEVPGLKWIAPEELKFRFAWWGFYDGLYDYLNPEWAAHVRNGANDRFAPAQFGITRFSQTSNINRSYTFTDQNKVPRKIYGERNRINELYIDYTKGPVFVRVGRQAISWGESDTIALLDVQNPFDLTLGAPGFFQDVDEARIPLWTLRTTVKLVDNWKFLSSGFVDAYVVPGIIDTTVPIDPITYGVSPFNPSVPNPQGSLFIGPTRNQEINQDTSLHTVVVDHLPENTWANTRWGARLQGLLFRDYTVQGWFFRTFNQAPVPLLSSEPAFTLATKGKTTLVDDRGFRTPICLDDNGNRIPQFLNGASTAGTQGLTPAGRTCGWKAPVVTSLNRRLESVIGLAGTWYSELLNGIIRTEAEYFIDELAFIPGVNLNPRSQIPVQFRQGFGYKKNIINTIPTADYLRWVIAYDRFFFFRPLNPTNSFVLSMSFNNQYNLSETAGKDFRSPQAKPGKSQAQSVPTGLSPQCRGKKAYNTLFCVTAVPTNYEDQYKYEGFLTTALQTEMMHGKLAPQVAIITDVSGIFAFAPTVTYRVSDSFLLTATYLAIAGSRQFAIGTFMNHDMVQLRATVQLN
ncbi:MAG TPA: DUF1302 family protein [Candidatus Binatia bacterium]|nr:DUF1302 family protein [Candidatus Binatia bacterium]